MAYRFNPLLKIGLDIVSTPGTTPLVPFDQVAADYTALPDPTVNDGEYWLAVLGPKGFGTLQPELGNIKEQMFLHT